MTIKVNKIIEEKALLYDPNGKYVGCIESGLELNDVRIQIKKERVGGYYILTLDGDRININDNGIMETWPEGFFDTYENQLDKLIGIGYN